MIIKRSLGGLLVISLATLALASSAMASGSSLVDEGNGEPINAGTILHAIGWARFATGVGSFECHTTLNLKAIGSTGDTGELTAFAIPDTTKCTGTGALNGCKLKAHSTTNLPYHATVSFISTIKLTGNIALHYEYSNCLAKKITIAFEQVDLRPLITGIGAVTGTNHNLAGTASLNEPIAGFEISGSRGPGPFGTGQAVITNIFGGKSEEEATTSGEFELTEGARCTYELIDDL